MRGRPPKSIEQRRLEGNPGKRPLPVTMPVSQRLTVLNIGDKELRCPTKLHPKARAAWKEIIEELARSGVLVKSDLPMFREFFQMFSRLWQVRDLLEADGLMSVGSMDQPVAHPLLAHEGRLQGQLLRFSEHMAATPIARRRMELTEAETATLAVHMAALLGEPETEYIGAPGDWIEGEVSEELTEAGDA